MKTIKFIIMFSICSFLVNNQFYSQSNVIPGCGLTVQDPSLILTPYKPSKSNGSSEEKLKILILHICFADDNNQPLYDDFWPPHSMPVSPNGNLPLLSANKITTGNFMDRYPAFTISDYFCEMSMGQLDVVGQDILVDLPQPYTSEYFRTNGYRRSTLNRFILQYIDANVNFAEYDNWRLQNDQWDYIAGGDGKVEMIVMNYRYIPNDPEGNVWFWDFIPEGASGEAKLGNPLYFGGPLTLDGKTINPDFNSDGSGVTALGQRLNYSGVTQIIEHEIAHHFFVTQLNTDFNIHTSNGIMTGVDATAYSMSPYERTRDILGWNISPLPYDPTGVYTLRDYISTGDMLLIQIPGTTNEWFWVANHQKVSLYDGVSRGSQNCYNINEGRQDPYCASGKGLFIYHHSSNSCENNYSKPIDIEQADGKWNWEVSKWVPYYNPQYNFCIPLFEHQINGGNPNTGKSEYLQEIMFINNPPSCWSGARGWGQEVTDNPCSENNNEYFVTLDANGDGLDAYNIGYDQIFSPYTNPASNSCQSPGTNTGVTINLLSQDESGNITVKVYFNDAQALNELPPGKPKNLKVKQEVINVSNGLFHPKLTWDGNKEIDFLGNDLTVGGYYIIYRAISNTCDPDINPTHTQIAIVSPDQSQWIDQDIFLYPTKGGQGFCSYLFSSCSYKIVAVDNTGAPSLPSDRSMINGFSDPCAPHDGSDNSKIQMPKIPETYLLLQNYPNPFNPTTEIKFDIPQNTFISLKVYNSLGEVVTELVSNEYKNAGSYNVTFDGSNFASGIYFYSIEAGVFKEIKKMVLIK